MTVTGDVGQHLAQDVLPAVVEAQQSMTLARSVPPDVEVLIDRLADELGGLAWNRSYDDVDPYLGQSLLAALLAGEKGLRAANEDDRRRRVRVSLERLRQTLRDIVDEAPANDETSIKEVVRWVVDTMSVPQSDVARLFGVSHRTLQRWSGPEPGRPDGRDEARVRMVARTLAHLRHVFTGPGTYLWFVREHPDLDGRAPVQLLDDPLELPRLVRLASRTRSTTAS